MKIRDASSGNEMQSGIVVSLAPDRRYGYVRARDSRREFIFRLGGTDGIKPSQLSGHLKVGGQVRFRVTESGRVVDLVVS